MDRALVDLAAAVVRRHPGLSRRDVLELAAFTATLVACRDKRRDGGEGSASSGGTTGPPRGGLDPTAYHTLEAVTARILPATTDFAGARDARVITYVDRQLAVAPLARVTPALMALARALDAQARTRGAQAFAELPVVEQDDVLGQLSRGTLPDLALPQRELFRVMHGLTLEGFLADPVHGGNHEQRGWKAIGFPEPSLRTPGAGHDGHGPHGGHGGHGG